MYKCSAHNGVMSKDGLLNFSENIYIYIEGMSVKIYLQHYLYSIFLFYCSDTSMVVNTTYKIKQWNNQIFGSHVSL